MRKIYLFMMLSLDGYFEGANHDLSWHNVDDEFNRFAVEMMRDADLFLFGRRTYQVMERAWPQFAKDPKISKENAEIARRMNTTKKIVFSKTLDKVHETADWKNVKLVHDFDPDAIRRLKEEPGKEIWVGGSDLALSFIREGLIDEFRFMVAPVVIGKGTPIFKGLGSKLNLELVRSREFMSGNVLLCYKPKKGR